MSQHKLKSNKKLKKLNLDEQRKCPIENGKIILSFRHVTTNKKYNFECFKKSDARKNLDARKALDKLFSEITNIEWVESIRRGKYRFGGCEKLLKYQIADINIPNMKVTDDIPVYIFRFGNQDEYRVCGIKGEGCHVLYIVAYDFDFSLYKHE